MFVKHQKSEDWLKETPKDFAQLFILDVPYNVKYKYNTFKDNLPHKQYIEEQVEMLKSCSEKLKEGGSIFYLNYPENAADVWARIDFMNRYEIITWIYNVHSSGSPVRKATRTWLWLSKGEPFYNEEAFASEYKNPTDKRVKQRIEAGFKPSGYDWWEFQQVKNVSKEKRNHPCQIPEKMVERIILGTTNPKDMVCDIYSGSGTTGICATRLGRRFYGCDMDEKYVKDANKFIQTEMKNKDLVKI